ncbi:MAG: hypothetical protein Q9173_000642 [Seirophora scorigena]
MDEAAAGIVLSLQLDDVDRLLKSPSDDYTGSTPSNSQLVLTAYRDKVTGRLGILRDRRRENIAINDRATAWKLDRQLNPDLSQAPDAPPPASIIDLTDRARNLIIDRFTRFNSLKPDIIDLTSRTKPHQKSLATTVPTTTAPARNPGAGNQLVNGKVNDVNKRAEHSPGLDHPHCSSGPQKRKADKDTVLDHERQTKRAKHHGSFAELEHPVMGDEENLVERADQVAVRRQPDQAGQASLGPAERVVIVTQVQNKLVDAEDECDDDWVHERSAGMCDFCNEDFARFIQTAMSASYNILKMIGGLLFSFWRFLEIITLIPTLGMLAYFVHQFESQNFLTPDSVLVLFIVSVLATAWAIATVLRRKSTRESALFVSFIDLCFIGAFIAGVYELRSIANADCTNFSVDDRFSITIDNNGVTGDSPFRFNTDKNCAMLKASFAFGIMNCIFFAVTSFLLLFMHRKRDDKEVAVKETYRRRSHDSR